MIRKTSRFQLMTIAILLLMGNCVYAGSEHWLLVNKCADYQVKQADLKQLESLIAESLKKDQAVSLKWQQAGFESRIYDWADGRYLAIREPEKDCRGRGSYVFYISGSKPANLVLQSPHQFKDLYTGEIQLKLMQQGRFLAAIWNTAGRDLKDMARLPQSPFISFTKQVNRHDAKVRMVQIHGFRRTDEAERNFAAIVSNGSQQPDYATSTLVRCLSAMDILPVAQYPRDTRILGATRNPVGRMLRRLGNGRFLHLELSKQQRLRLRSDLQAQIQLSQCLTKLDL